jgi:hypothetical protein
VLTVAAELAIEAVPVRFAVIVLAEKFPDPSLNTNVEDVLLDVAFESIVNAVPSPAVPIVDMPLPEVDTEAA